MCIIGPLRKFSCDRETGHKMVSICRNKKSCVVIWKPKVKSKYISPIFPSHFWMTRTELVRVVQHSRILLWSWRANSDIKLLLYYSDPSCPDISEIEDVCWYVVAYTGKQHNTTQSEKDAIQIIILKWVQFQTHWQNIHIPDILFMTTIHHKQ